MSDRYENGVVIPYQNLSQDALRGLIEEYVSRDHGALDMTMNQRLDQVKSRLDSGAAVIVYDVVNGTSNIVDKDFLK